MDLSLIRGLGRYLDLNLSQSQYLALNMSLG